VVLCLSLPPFGFWPFAFVGLAAVDRLIADQPVRSRSTRGWLIAMGCFVPGLSWMTALTATATGPSGAVVTFTTSASDIVDGTVSVTCTPSSGATFAPGMHTVSCTTTDSHHNPSNGAFAVTVLFDLGSGFLQPVNPAALNTVKGGSTVPLKWTVRTPSGGEISALSIVNRFVLTQVLCGSLTTVVDEVDFTTTGGTELRYSGGQFIQNWQTPKKAGSCYRIDIVFIGGQKLSANFQLK
jgi:hypothetical protein